MVIRCKYCGEEYDLKSRLAIDMYLAGVALRCKRCLGDIYSEEEKK